MKVQLVLCVFLMKIIITVHGQAEPLRNDVKVCTADTPGREWVRRGSHLRKRGNCQQGYVCYGPHITELRQPCPDRTYFSVHTGTCSFPNVYAYIFSSFNCSAEESDINLDFDQMTAKRDQLCRPLMELTDPDTTELYVGDPDNCRQTYKCPLVAVHDDWLHLCPVGTRFGDGWDGVCMPDDIGCGHRY